jgi:hypothetical protein
LTLNSLVLVAFLKFQYFPLGQKYLHLTPIIRTHRDLDLPAVGAIFSVYVEGGLALRSHLGSTTH